MMVRGRKPHKTLVVGFLLLLELGLLLGLSWKLGASTGRAYGALEALSVLAVVGLISGRENPSYKLAWIVIILVFPLFGMIIYVLAGTPLLSPRLRRESRAERHLVSGRRTTPSEDADMEALAEFGAPYARQAAFIRRLTGRPVFRGTKAELLTPGESFFAAMFDALRGAEHFIFLEFFIVSEGSLLTELLAILKEKAAQGVEILFLYDDAGSMDTLPRFFRARCAEIGVRAAPFNPFMPVLDKFMGYRDHRKIAVADGTVGFTGGINIADEYVNRVALHGHWKDTGVELRGDAVRSLTQMFLEMWGGVTGESLDAARYLAARPQPDDGFLLPFHDSPFLGGVAQGAILGLAGASTRTLYIMTPYLILDNETTVALCNAARGGVDVRIVTPHIPDKSYVHAVTRDSYARLMEAGVHIYEYTPGFVHSKVMLSDGVCGLVGSVNMDFRSFYLQFEDAVWFCGGSLPAQMAADFAGTFTQSRRVDPVQWRRRPFWGKLAAVFLRLFSPLM